MKKSELQNLDLVFLKDYERPLVIVSLPDGMGAVSYDGGNYGFADLKENEIESVYRCTARRDERNGLWLLFMGENYQDIINRSSFEKIYPLEEAKELTVEQVSEALGYEVKIVK
jgi:hypothetical protein